MKKSVKKVVSIILSASLLLLGGAAGKPVYASKKPIKLVMNTRAVLIKVHGKKKLEVSSVKPEKASRAVKYEVANRKIARITKKGMVKGRRVGVTTVRVTAKKNKNLHVLVKIMVAKLVPKKVKLSHQTLTMAVGEQMKLTATVTPVKVTKKYKAGSWVSTDKEVASVSDKGLITANKIGEASVSFTTLNGKTASCKVMVNPQLEPVVSQEPVKSAAPVKRTPSPSMEPSESPEESPVVLSSAQPTETPVTTSSPAPVNSGSPEETVSPSVNPVVTPEPTGTLKPTASPLPEETVPCVSESPAASPEIPGTEPCGTTAPATGSAVTTPAGITTPSGVSTSAAVSGSSVMAILQSIVRQGDFPASPKQNTPASKRGYNADVIMADRKEYEN